MFPARLHPSRSVEPFEYETSRPANARKQPGTGKPDPAI